MRRLTAYVSGNVQQTGYRARVTDFERALGFKGFVENLDDGRVRIVAEGEDDRLKWFEEAIKDLIGEVNGLGDKLGGKLDIVIEKQDQMRAGQNKMIDLQHDLLDEVKESRKDLRDYLDQRFEKLEDEVVEMRAALRAKGII